MTKFIFITGGVLSALGKGIAAASIGRLMESQGYKITCMKFDPYLNVDPGTMSPFQHGEVYVTDDGAETDLDLGHYELFTTTQTSKSHNWTAGKIYESILKKERKGEFRPFFQHQRATISSLSSWAGQLEISRDCLSWKPHVRCG